MKRVCFVGTDSYSMLYPSTETTPVGGEAVQQFLLAKAFKELGHNVSMVIRAVETDIDDTIDDIKILSAFKLGEGFPLLRFFHPRASGLFRALNKIDADVYYQSPAAGLTGLTAAFCKLKHKKFIFRVASNVDCVPGQQLIELWRDRSLFEYGLRRADLVAVQSCYQQNLLRKHYGLDSTVINMAMDLPEEDLDRERDIDVLWVSNLKTIKRPDRLLAIAKRLKNTSFTMIGGASFGEERYYAEIEKQAEQLRNVRFVGRVPYRDVNKYVARSKLFLNTSDIEGFPNTFLQAWVRKVPVISFFDPDQLIVRQGLGKCPASDEDMSDSICELLEDSEKREKIGAVAHDFAIRNYSPTVAAEKYINTLES